MSKSWAIPKRDLIKEVSIKDIQTEGFIDEQVNNLLLSRKAYIGSLTKKINKITCSLSDENNKNSVIDENKKIDITVSHMRRITSELKELYTDETKVNKALEFGTEQVFWVIQNFYETMPFIY